MALRDCIHFGWRGPLNSSIFFIRGGGELVWAAFFYFYIYDTVCIFNRVTLCLSCFAVGIRPAWWKSSGVLQTDKSIIYYYYCHRVRQLVMVRVRQLTRTSCTVVAPDTRKLELSQIMYNMCYDPLTNGTVSVLCGCCVCFVACAGSPVSLFFIRPFFLWQSSIYTSTVWLSAPPLDFATIYEYMLPTQAVVRWTKNYMLKKADLR